ncbi:MAG: endonuclease domain-containing protein [Thermomicrobiales bacterium]|nr:endonuclease domain-containing protein [Thermomicrobiales bacterium]
MGGRKTSTGRFRGTSAELDETARDVRRAMTPAERVLWRELRNHRLGGFSFRRQHPFGSYIIDFACPSRRLAIEVDGAVHACQTEQDEVRTAVLENWGWMVIRFSNDQILSEMPFVLDEIVEILTEREIAPGHRSKSEERFPSP